MSILSHMYLLLRSPAPLPHRTTTMMHSGGGPPGTGNHGHPYHTHSSTHAPSTLHLAHTTASPTMLPCNLHLEIVTVAHFMAEGMAKCTVYHVVIRQLISGPCQGTVERRKGSGRPPLKMYSRNKQCLKRMVRSLPNCHL